MTREAARAKQGSSSTVPSKPPSSNHGGGIETHISPLERAQQSEEKARMQKLEADRIKHREAQLRAVAVVTNRLLLYNRLDDMDGISDGLGKHTQHLFLYLWAKNKEGLSCPGVRITDTIMVKDGRPDAWIFQNAAGQIMKKSKEKLNDRNELLHCLLTNPNKSTKWANSSREEVAAVHVWPDDNDTGGALMMLDAQSLRRMLLQEALPPGIIQRYIHDFNSCYTMLHAAWHPNFFYLLETKGPIVIDKKIGDEVPVELPKTAASRKLSDRAKAMCECIVSHVREVSPQHYKIVYMKLHFKSDAHGILYLLWCSALRLQGAQYVDADTPMKPVQQAPKLGATPEPHRNVLGSPTKGENDGEEGEEEEEKYSVEAAMARRREALLANSTEEIEANQANRARMMELSANQQKGQLAALYHHMAGDTVDLKDPSLQLDRVPQSVTKAQKEAEEAAKKEAAKEQSQSKTHSFYRPNMHPSQYTPEAKKARSVLNVYTCQELPADPVVIDFNKLKKESKKKNKGKKGSIVSAGLGKWGQKFRSTDAVCVAVNGPSGPPISEEAEANEIP
ncbi:hypothetical protein CYMTET_8833 [Cymbomonas tetramitiformis]|uniref:Uncharacterized protein n=1 Tax=Cymbomonas tetramitiformis TaxID=36881 RepID=A0AAE0GS94_9CHLO|nr:hypothetical protein CYMTET_8833 [Cymbomonas tetramitiformis]